jgi:hypothetical protein
LVKSKPACKGDVWLVRAGGLTRHVLVISSDMFNVDSGLGHVLAMLVMAEPGPYSVAAVFTEGEELSDAAAPGSWHVWPAHLYSTPKTTLVRRVAMADETTVSAAHTRLFMMLYESSIPPNL